ncbi:amidase [Kineosporia sp. R_H_3]|uniref:amidase n=1 Tax=Kineosporia sp. R_H_3 TaxID=1961848 RepID=UPI000B4A8769|nr:amidase [Kineosporia sp. R_H_3]
MSDLHYLSATEVLRAFRARELSPVEVLDAVNARADAVEPTVNALLERDHEDFRAAAVAAERRYAGTGEAPRALEGLPVALKEEQPIQGRSLRFGSRLTEGYVADETHPVAERVLAAGAVVHARTTTPEFSCAGFTHSDLWGVTRNPWNPDFTPGGSSGGSGAALAAGTAYLASGSDIGGSIRIPASFCGVVGFKAPYGRVPALPPFNLDVYCHDGAMGRTVADVALFHNVVQGRHRVDHVSLPALPIPADLGDVRGLRVALAVTLGDFPVEPEVEANTRTFADALKAAGAVVEEVRVPISRAALTEAALVHYGAVMGPSMAEVADPDDPRFMAYTRQFLALSSAAFARTGTYAGMAAESAVHLALAEVFDGHDALVCPTVGGLGFEAGNEYPDGIDVAGTHLDLYIFAALTPVFNVASRHPVLNVPSGRASNGVPTGVQVVARPYDDVTAFHVGAAAERELGLWADPAWRPAL